MNKPLKHPYYLSLTLLALSYLLFEWIYIPFEALAADELVFAKHIYEYTQHLPYRDFAPYKSVLGHYLLSLPLFFTHGLFDPIFSMKHEITIINVTGIALTGYLGATLFDKKAVLLTLLALLSNHYFLIYSTDLRVDMLSAWLCLFSLLTFLRKEIKLSGILMGLAFLISQKAIWYLIAINGGMLLCLYYLSPRKTPLLSVCPGPTPKHLLTFNSFTILTIILYLTLWSLLTGPSLVLQNFFYEAYIQAGIDYYMPIYWICWQTVMSHGPLLFLLWPIATFYIKNIFILSTASIALFLFIIYKQPFPYNFVFTFPAFFILYAEFFTCLYTRDASLRGRSSGRSNPVTLLIAFFIAAGILYPLFTTLHASLDYSGRYQRTMAILTAQLIDQDGDYVSGIPFIFKKDQPITGMKNLIGPQLEYLVVPSDKMAKLLLPSLYLAKTTPEQIIREFEQSNVKVILSNYRMRLLPARVAAYLDDHYQHYYGSIYLYAPRIHPSQLSFYLKFTAQYRIAAETDAIITIDGKRIKNNQLIWLPQGDHLTYAAKNYRLVLIPHIDVHLDPAYQQDRWLRMVKAIVA